jgi:hypothetical protein
MTRRRHLARAGSRDADGGSGRSDKRVGEQRFIARSRGR